MKETIRMTSCGPRALFFLRMVSFMYAQTGNLFFERPLTAMGGGLAWTKNIMNLSNGSLGGERNGP